MNDVVDFWDDCRKCVGCRSAADGSGFYSKSPRGCGVVFRWSARSTCTLVICTGSFFETLYIESEEMAQMHCLLFIEILNWKRRVRPLFYMTSNDNWFCLGAASGLCSLEGGGTVATPDNDS